MEPSKKLIDEIYLERLRRAETMTPEERFLAGPRLFDLACQWTKAGIRAANPGLDEDGVMRVLRERLELARALEQIE